MSKIAYISITIILTAVMLAGCTGATDTPTPTPTVTMMPTNQSVSPSPTPPQSTSEATPTPTVKPIRTTKVPVKTSYLISYVEFKVYADKVTIEYLSGQGKLYVNSDNMGGSGNQSEYLEEPGNITTLGFNSTAAGQGQNASITLYQVTDSGMTYGMTRYYPGTGEVKEM